MVKELKWIIDITDTEYNGHSFNGHNWVKTVTALSLEQLKITSVKGYSIWSIFLHTAYYKWLLIKFIDPENPSDFPFERTNFPPFPGEGTRADWEKTLSVCDNLHKEYIHVLESLTEQKLDEKIVPWHCTVGKAIAWAATHETYHIAMIRNMGVPAL